MRGVGCYAIMRSSNEAPIRRPHGGAFVESGSVVMRAVFMGTPSCAVIPLSAMLTLGAQVVGVYTQPDRPSGRGQPSQASSVKSFALEHGLKVYQPTSLRSPDVQKELASLAPDVILVAAYGKLLPPEVLRIPPHGCVNLHPSLLPRYRGPSPVATAVLNGEAETGTTLFLMDEGMDTGPILSSKAVAIGAGATTQSLTPLLFQLGADLLIEFLPMWLNGEIAPQSQDQDRATVTKKLDRVDGEADWGLTAEELERRLRAFTPWPNLYTFWEGRRVKLLAGLATDNPSGERNSGLVVPLGTSEAAVGVVTGAGILGLRQLQLEGRRSVSSQEFIRGYRDFVGARLPS